MSKNKSNQSTDLTTRLNNARGRMLGIHTVTSRGEAKYNGQLVSQSPNFLIINDRNKNKQFKIAKRTVVDVSGI